MGDGCSRWATSREQNWQTTRMPVGNRLRCLVPSTRKKRSRFPSNNSATPSCGIASTSISRKWATASISSNGGFSRAFFLEPPIRKRWTRHGRRLLHQFTSHLHRQEDGIRCQSHREHRSKESEYHSSRKEQRIEDHRRCRRVEIKHLFIENNTETGFIRRNKARFAFLYHSLFLFTS